MNKKNKIVLITGAGSGLGKATAEYLAKMKCFVIGTDINEDALKKLKNDFISTIYLDVTDISSIKNAYKIVQNMTEGIDVLVNNAGIFDQMPLVEGNINRYERLINVNVLGAFRVTNIFFPLLYRARSQIINISSETAKTLLPFQTYGSSKYMMEAWSNTLRMELKLLGIPVSLVRAGGHKTPLMRKTLNVINKVPEDSLFKHALNKVKKEGGERVLFVDKPPSDIAKTIYKIINSRNPKRIYSVNESNLYRFLSVLPRSLKEALITGALK